MPNFHEISSKYIVKAFHILTMNICHYSLFCFVFGKLVLLNYYNRYRLSRERKKSNLQRLISSDFHILSWFNWSFLKDEVGFVWSLFLVQVLFATSSTYMIKCTFPTKFFRDLFFVLRKKGKWKTAPLAPWYIWYNKLNETN